MQYTGTGKKRNLRFRNKERRIQGMFYDPLGLILPTAQPIKFILQKLFELKFGWDKYIDTDTSQLWKQYINVRKHVSSVSVNRHVLCCERSYVHLHGSCDSFEKAYFAVVYGRLLCNHGVKVTLSCGRSRVVSPKGHCISRLELMAYVFLARLITEVKKSIENCCRG